jgi:hypothetical protein
MTLFSKGELKCSATNMALYAERVKLKRRRRRRRR